ncbi:5207_t:CDS:2 [Ambispora gerdemannii]|uniref:5207_t:CDS:1 n=1 Tax=Ambispora gerdemannii TaxID=144530 RepID=A0A9N9DA35_9GLOM|nr:5207_t:CDS:2 [Ambispora gerdemannii]
MKDRCYKNALTNYVTLSIDELTKSAVKNRLNPPRPQNSWVIFRRDYEAHLRLCNQNVKSKVKETAKEYNTFSTIASNSPQGPMQIDESPSLTSDSPQELTQINGPPSLTSNLLQELIQIDGSPFIIVKTIRQPSIIIKTILITLQQPFIINKTTRQSSIINKTIRQPPIINKTSLMI